MVRPKGQREPKRYGKKTSKGKYEFKEGNPGRPKGSLNKVTLLKNKILVAALSRDLNENHQIVVGKGKRRKVISVRDVTTTDLMKVGATFVPKEVKGDGPSQVTINFPGFKNGQRPK